MKRIWVLLLGGLGREDQRRGKEERGGQRVGGWGLHGLMWTKSTPQGAGVAGGLLEMRLNVLQPE